MSFLLDGLKTAFAGAAQTEQQTTPETVEKLVDRVQTSTLLEDRRGACRALKIISKKHRIEVGAQGMNALVNVLQTDSSDYEIVSYSLDALCNITSPELLDDEIQPHMSHDLGRIGVEFTEIFIKQPDNVGLVLTFLEEFDFRVRWPAIKLLTNLLINKPKEIQEVILVSPMAVSRLMDLLGDTREVIRNDVLLLLIQLTKGNANLQKIVAFENAFDRIFDVIEYEGGVDGGIVVKDSFILMLNLLRNNTSNINFFKEGSYIPKLSPMCVLPAESEEGDHWSSQRVENIHCILQVIRTLVTPSNPMQVTCSCQKLLKTSGLLEALCNMLMASGVPVDVLTETINTVAEVIRGNFPNQEYFANVTAPSKPPRSPGSEVMRDEMIRDKKIGYRIGPPPHLRSRDVGLIAGGAGDTGKLVRRSAIVVLLMSMVNEKQPFSLRCAVLYCFQCFLFKNEFGQAQLIQTLLPSSSEVSSLTCGQLLCGGLFSTDPISNWFSSVALSHGVIENPAEKEHLLKVLLSTSAGAAPVSLLHQCSLLLQQNNELQSKLGLLMLLSMWLSHCPLAVSQFLSIPSNIPFLTAQAGSTEHDDNEELLQGLCAFLMGICVHFNDNSVSSFTKENLCHIILKRIGLEMFLDKLGAVSKHEEYSKAAKHPQLRPAHANELLLDHEFCRLFKALEGMVGKSVSPKVDFLNGVEVPDTVLVLQYKDLIREQDAKLQEFQREIETLRANEKVSLHHIDDLQSTVAQLKDENLVLRAHANTNIGELNHGYIEQIEYWKKECERWKIECANVARVKDEKIHDLEKEIQSVRAKSLTLSEKMDNLSVSNSDPVLSREEREGLNSERNEVQETERKLLKLDETELELEKLRKDQEDLLELLTDQDIKLNIFKEKLKALGEKVDDDDEDSILQS